MIALRLICIVSLAAAVVPGCSTILAVKEQQALAARISIVSGKVAATDHAARGPFVVALLARSPTSFRVVDHFVTEKAGPWVFAVEPGTYWLAAFEDVNGDGRYDGEPARRLREDEALTLADGQRMNGIDLDIPSSGRFSVNNFSVAELVARSQAEQQILSVNALSVAGEVAKLSDARFDREIASSGLWKPYDFLVHVRPGIYFLEPYDPGRIPVLFVHGAGGTPREFEYLTDALDRKKFQAWVAYYPSGSRLDTLGRWLAQIFVRLRAQYDFRRAAVVAHSMGGLVTREFVLHDHELSGSDSVRTYVTISSPLGGMASAGKGVERSPVVLGAWHGLAPKSAFLDGLYYRDAPKNTVRRKLPKETEYHLLFGYRGGGPEGSGDGTVTLASELRDEAQEEARSIRGFDEDHTSVLRSAAVASRLNEILAGMR